MKGEHTPLFPADAKNLSSLINFIVDAKKCEKWMKLAKEVIARNQKLLATIGKAAEIEKLHAEAAELKEVVLGAVEKRATALAAEREKFKTEMAERRATIKQEAHDAGARTTAQRNEARVLLSGAKQKDEAATEALSAATKAQAQAEAGRDRVKALREELEAQRGRVKELAEAAAA
jgi:3-methyladenine DNA glycosylase Tag